MTTQQRGQVKKLTEREALDVLAEYLREETHEGPNWGPEDDYAPCPGDTCQICQLWDAYEVLSQAEYQRKEDSRGK